MFLAVEPTGKTTTKTTHGNIALLVVVVEVVMEAKRFQRYFCVLCSFIQQAVTLCGDSDEGDISEQKWPLQSVVHKDTRPPRVAGDGWW